MCSAGASIKKASADYSALLDIEQIEEELIPRYYINAFSFPKIYTIKQGHSKVLSNTHWGLIPSFIHDWEKASVFKTQTINAKAETVFEKISFKNSIINNRCVVLFDGFFEYQHHLKEKIPYYVYPKDHSFFMMGGLYNNWLNKSTGELLSTCSIITTEANSLMSEIHNSKKRMPLIFDKEAAHKWLEKDLKQDEIKSLLTIYPDSKMEAHQVNKTLISPKNIDIQNPDIILPYMDTKGRQESLF
ncbi:MAG: SOS response-associated peptidase [Bacteroidota bacterium]